MTRSLLFFLLALAVAATVAYVALVLRPPTAGEGFAVGFWGGGFTAIAYGLTVLLCQRSIVAGYPYIERHWQARIWWYPAVLAFGALVLSSPVMLIVLWIGMPWSLIGLLLFLLALVVWR